MSVLQIHGGRRLSGQLRLQGAKNSVLPIMAASILSGRESVIHNCPHLLDVDVTVRILRHLGCRVEREGGDVYIDSAGMNRWDIPDHLMREMRSSVVFLGAILARAGEVQLSLPGGCELGPRPIDMHLAAIRALGVQVDDSGGKIVCRACRPSGGRIDFATPSVGATENAMLAASRAQGTTVITNPAREPEICDLQSFLQKLGVRIHGAGSSVITIEGVREMTGAEHSIIPDRIVAATWLSAVTAAGGEIVLTGTIPQHFDTVTEILRRVGCEIEVDRATVRAKRAGALRAAPPVVTGPYPAFPTDAQPPVMAACLRAEGTTVFVENMFENRYRHAPEMMRMGAQIKTEGKFAIVCGVPRLHGAKLAAADLRGGAALIVAALGAEGTSEISGLRHIDRGYEGVELALSQLGADIKRIGA